MKRKMRDSGVAWIGEVPEGWKVSAIKYCGEVYNGREIGVELDESDLNAIPVYGSGGVFKYTDRFQYNGEAVLFGRKGTIGKPLYANCAFASVDTMYYSTYGTETSTKYVFYLLTAFDWSPFATHTAVPSMVASDVFRERFCFPPLAEQRAIAAYLDAECGKIDGLRGKLESQIADLESYKKSIITEAVTKGLKRNRKMKPSGVEWIGDVPEEWEVGRIKNVAEISTGFTPSRSVNAYFSQECGVPWIKAENLGGFSSVGETSEYLTELGQRVGRCFPPNCVYVCCIASVGKVGYSNQVASCNQQINALHFSESYFFKYGFYAMVSAESEHQNLASGNVVAIINTSTQKNIKIPIPPLSEQREIAAYLDEKCGKIDAAAAKCREQLEDLSAYKKSLIYECVTGKKEVT